jgi:type I restriction enzyme S subunit
LTGTAHLARLQDVAELNPSLDAILADDEAVSFLPMSAVDAEAVDAVDAESRPFKQVSKGYTPFIADDVLVAKITPCFENGKIAQAKPTRRVGFGSTEFHVIRTNQSELIPRYLVHFLRQERIRKDGERKMTGSAGQRRVPEHFLANLAIPLPPLSEQRRIAEILDKSDALRAKRRAALAQLDTLTQSIFLDMFGDPGSNPRKWPQQTLETFFHFRTGKLDSNAAVISGEYPFFTCSKDESRIDTFAFDCEALLLAGNNATADYSVKHYKGKFNAYQRTYVITLQNEDNSYEYSRFVLEDRLAELKRLSTGTGTKYLTLELLNRIRVPVPSRELQSEFARRVRLLEKEKRKQQMSRAELDALFVSLQHWAFGGTP